MTRNLLNLLRRSLRDDAAQTLVMAALVLVLLLGLVGFVVDTGHLYYSYQELQASTNASAMAAANGLATSYASAQYNAAEYSSAASFASQYGYTGTVQNAYENMTVTNFTVTPGCIGSAVPAAANIPCINITDAAGQATTANAIQVSQTIQVRTYFAPFLGIPYVNLTAKASALMRGSPAAYNIALIVDTTGSMNTTDSSCNNNTRLQCALNGIQTFLQAINPCGFGGCQGVGSNTSNYTNSFDRVALFAFPNGQTNAIPNDYGCNGLPQDELNPEPGINVSNYDNAVPYVFPPINGTFGTTQYNYTTRTGWKYVNGRLQPVYTTKTYDVTSEVTNGLGDANGFMSNYQDGDSLNTGSNLVMALGGKQNCPSIQAPYIDGTYYASTIYQAQSALSAEQAAYPGTQNVMIIIGDGDSNVSYDYLDASGSAYKFNSMVYQASQTNGLVPTGTNDYGQNVGTPPSASNNYYPSWNNDCGQAILAAAYAKDMGTTVYTVAYGSPTGGAFTSQNGCSTDTTGIALGTDGVTNQSTGLTGSSYNITPCQTLKDMASSDATFFSDFHQSGSDHGCVATTNINFQDLASIFTVIAGDLQHSRLIPNMEFTPSS